jgi:serine O-acetyltransferase
MNEQKNYSQILQNIATQLSHHESNPLEYLPKHGHSMPSVEMLGILINKLREVFFPGYFGNSSLNSQNLHYHIGVNVDDAFHLLKDQIYKGICFSCSNGEHFSESECEFESKQKALMLIERLPGIKKLLSTDVKAAFMGDPAAKSEGEVVFSYPAIRAMSNHRIAHELYKLDVPLIPRIISEMAHSETGIDIHPGAQIGEFFAIDHGTGVVIGETAIIGKNVKIYQGVTLGARSFPLDNLGKPIKGIARHPIVEDDVIIYSNATILGRVNIGKGSVIGGNVWITKDLPPNSKIVQQHSARHNPNSGHTAE